MSEPHRVDSTRLRSALISLMLCLSILGAKSAQDDLEVRYWRALNEGRDVSGLIPALDGLTWQAKTDPARDALRADALERLRRIQESAPLDAVVNRAADASREPGADWPSLGGGPEHTGSTSDRGPLAGEEVWRYPVGWPWRGAARIEGDKVYIASPGIDVSMLCLERNTGNRLWAAENPGTGFGRQSRAASPVIALGDRELAVCKESFDGWPLTYLVVSRDNGRILRSLPARPQEKAPAPPETEPAQLVANRLEKGTQVLVKSLLTGRTWWCFPTGYLPAEPVLRGERVYAASEDGTLWALNLHGDQRVAWTHSIRASWGAPPDEREGILFAGANDGTVYALDSATGKVRWQTPVAKPDSRARQLFSAAALANGRVYLGAADGNLCALDERDGKLLWRHDCGDWIRARPLVAGKTVCVATLDGEVVAVEDLDRSARPLWTSRLGRHPVCADLAGDARGVLACDTYLDLVAFDLQTGREQWRQSLLECARENGVKQCADSMPDIAQAPVTVAGGTAFFAGRNGFVEAADAATGRRRWRFESSGRLSAAPTTRDGRVFVTQVGGNRLSYALDAASGHVLWSRDLGEVWAPPECDPKQLFVGNKGGVLYCLDPATGETSWERRFGEGVYPAPALDATAVYTGSWDGHYYALNRRDGRILWAFSRPGRPYQFGGRPDSAAPVLAQGKVLVPNLGGRMVALDAKTGALLWEWTGKPYRICNVTAATDGKVVLTSVFGNAYEWPFDVRLVGLELATGRELWEIPGAGGLTSPILTGGGRFVVGSMGGPFLCGYQMDDSRTETPRLLWRLRAGGVMYESLPAVSGSLGFFLSNDGWLRAVR